MKVGDLVKLKPNAAERNAESVGLGVVIKEGKDEHNQEFAYGVFLKMQGKPWFRYKTELELVEDVKKM